MTNYDAESGDAELQDLNERVARDADTASDVMRITTELSDRRGFDYDRAHPLDGLDTESLASFNLRRIRKAVGLSQQQIADRIASQHALGRESVKLSQTQIAKIERGERPWRLNELVAVSAALGVELNEFFAAMDASNDGQMLVLTAKLKYQRAQAVEEEARELLRDGIRTTYKRENELLKVAAKYDIKDPEVMKILTFRALRNESVVAAEKDLEAWPDPERVEARQEAALMYVAEEWDRLVEEAKREAGPEVEPRHTQGGDA